MVQVTRSSTAGSLGWIWLCTAGILMCVVSLHAFLSESRFWGVQLAQDCLFAFFCFLVALEAAFPSSQCNENTDGVEPAPKRCACGRPAGRAGLVTPWVDPPAVGQAQQTRE